MSHGRRGGWSRGAGTTAALALVALWGAPRAGWTQMLDAGPASPLLGGVPTGEASATVLALSLDEALARGLQHNLGLILGAEGVRAARGERWRALSEVLPNLRGEVSETRQKINLAAFGLTLPGIPQLVGPFNVVDARVFLSQSILDAHKIYAARAEAANLEAAREIYRSTRDRVVLACASLYLQAVAGSSRIGAARAQLETAEALYRLAVDRKEAGLVPGVDVLRAEVQRDALRQRLIIAQNVLAKDKLAIARAIGLPLGQEFALTDRIPFAPLPPGSPEDARERAYRDRADFQAAQAHVRAAELARKAAVGNELPSLSVRADYGAIGLTVGSALATYTLGADVHVPIFEGGQAHGKILQAEAALRARRAELEDLRAGIYYELQAAFLDLTAAEERVHVAERAVELAKEQLQQAQDRFAAGVTNNIEVLQAQDALAAATENYISGVYDHSVAKASLADALGGAERTVHEFLKGE